MPVSPAEFDLLDQEGRFELLNGEIIEMASASGPHNFLAGKLARRIGAWLDEHGGAAIHATEFAMGDNRFQPDVAVISLERWKRIGSMSAPIPEPPDIAIEVVSPSESAFLLDQKVTAYLLAGVQEVWVLYHSTEHLFIHTADQVRRLDLEGTIETPLLPGWSLAMTDLLRHKNGLYFRLAWSPN